jgi:hypothetical protein
LAVVVAFASAAIVYYFETVHPLLILGAGALLFVLAAH